jgi:hypothetical protein
MVPWRSGDRPEVVVGLRVRFVAAVESLRRLLLDVAWFPSRAEVTEVHARLFGPDGYRPDHPVRALFVAEFVANTWIGA